MLCFRAKVVWLIGFELGWIIALVRWVENGGKGKGGKYRDNKTTNSLTITKWSFGSIIQLFERISKNTSFNSLQDCVLSAGSVETTLPISEIVLSI